MAGLTDTGFVALSQEEIEADIKASLRSKVSPNIDLEPDSPNGQIATILARQFALLWEAAQAVYASQDPDQATGRSLTAVSALTGTDRLGETPSTATVTVNVDAGTYAVGDLVVSVDGDPTARFANSEEVTNAGPDAANFDTLFTCLTNGPVRANSGLLTVIESFSGFNSAVNGDDAVLGRLVEEDEISNQGVGLRLRREQDLAAAGSTSAPAIFADVDVVAGVTSVTVLSNEGDVTDANGLPPHSVEAIVEGGLDADIAKAVFLAKSAGTGTHGTTATVIEDSTGTERTINWSRPSDVNIYIDIELTARAKSYIGNAGVISAITDLYQAVGGDVIYKRIVATIMELPGLKDDPDADITSLKIGTTPSPVGTTNVVTTPRQLAKYDSSRINVTSTLLGF